MRKNNLIKNSLVFVVASLLVGALFILNPAQTNKAGALNDGPEEVVTYLAEERNISIEEAQTRIEWQNKETALDDKLLEMLPKTDYGSLWINNSNDKVNVGLISGSDTADSSRQRVIEEARVLGMSDGVEIVPVKYSFERLRSTINSLLKVIKENVSEEEWPIQIGMKTDENKVQVDMPEDKNLKEGHRVVLAEIEKKYKDQVIFRTYTDMPQELAECSWWYCNSPLRGGVGMHASNNGYTGNIYCTAGFIVQGNATGNLQVLTAGHCAPGGNGWDTQLYNYSQKLIGDINVSIYNGSDPIDAMIIKIEDANGWDVMGKILKRGTSNSDMGRNGVSPPSYNEEYNISTYSSSYVNDRVCISPAVTGGWGSQPQGGSCGKVHETLAAFNAGGTAPTTITTRAGLCVRDGDSGSPIYGSNNDARGILRGKGTGGVCSDNVYFTPMRLIMERFEDIGSGISIY